MASLSAVVEADCAQENLKVSRSLDVQTPSIGMVSKAERIIPNCTNLSEFLKTVDVAEEGDAQSWLAAWKATAELAHAMAEHGRESVDKYGRR